MEKEQVMHQAWAGQLFDFEGLVTMDGQRLRLIAQGELNTNQGPDFKAAQIALDGIEQHGDVELHLDSQDWFRHGHHSDPRYNAVMLHVVMDATPCQAVRQDGSLIPTLSLDGRVGAENVVRAKRKLSGRDTLPCTAVTGAMSDAAREEVLAWAGKERAFSKIQRVRKAVEKIGGDWEAALWIDLAAALGGPVNAEAFREIAARVPYGVLRRYAHRPAQCESLLFGGAGLLEGKPWDEYHVRLADEWNFLSSKHALEFQHMPLRQHRMRPASFPALRLSQAASLLQHFPQLSVLLGQEGVRAFMGADIEAASYWRRNNAFGAPSKIAGKHLGKAQKMAIVINVLLPYVACYREVHGMGDGASFLRNGLLRLPAEENKVTRKFNENGWHAQSAFHTQGMLHLNRERCLSFGCMSCPVWTTAGVSRAACAKGSFASSESLVSLQANH